MGTTASGLVYPDPTDPVDVAGDMQELAESVDDAYLTGGAWVTATTGFTAASGFSLQAVRYRILGALVSLDCTMTKTTADLTNTIAGNPANTTILSAIPAAITPAQSQGLGAIGGDSSISSRSYGIIIASGGTAILATAGGTQDIINGQRITFAGLYLLN